VNGQFHSIDALRVWKVPLLCTG